MKAGRKRYPGEAYISSLTDQTDLYVVESGPNSRSLRPGVPLKHLEVPHGNNYDPKEAGYSDNFDPQPPRLMSYAELAEKIIQYEAAWKENSNC